MSDKSKTVTLLDPNGQEFQTDDVGLANSLLLAHGYTEKSGKKSAESSDEKPAK